MPVNRFYLDCDDYAPNTSVCLSDAEHHHLARVMRCAVGEEVELVNGRGGLARAKIEEIEKKLTSLLLLSATRQPPPLFSISAAVPLMRSAKLEWVVEKGTELGADAFLLYGADYSEKETLSSNQRERLHLLAVSALKQSGRLFLPRIEILPDLSTVLHREGVIYFGDTSETAPSLRSQALLHKEGSLLFITGPERGFSPEERALLQKKGRGVRLNPHILRAETAPLAALAILAH